MSKTKERAVVAVALALQLGMPSALAVASPDQPTGRHSAAQRVGGTSGAGAVRSVSPALRKAFSVFSRPPAARVPRYIHAIASSALFSDYRLNPKLSRSVAAPGGGSRWFVVPGKDSVCLAAAGSVDCVPLAFAKTGGLMLKFVRPSGASPVPETDTGVSATIVGLVPDAITAVTGVQANDGEVLAASGQNVYRLVAEHLVSVRLTRRNGEATLIRVG